MVKEERSVFLNREYAEAVRYMDNAKEVLARARRDGSHYVDRKYVRMACGTAYLGVLIGIEAWLVAKDVDMPSKKKYKSIEFYEENVAKLDGKMLSYLNTAYNQLHLEGYYRTETSVKAISAGFDAAYYIIEKIKPDCPVEVRESRSDGFKRRLNMLLISAAVMFR